MKLSPTAIITYLTCPKRYYLKYVLGAREQYIPQIEKGLVFHKFIEEYYKIIPDKLTKNEVSKYVSYALEKLSMNYSEYANELQGFIKWENWRINNLSNRKPEVEVEVENETFYGRIDAIFDNKVVEFKTGYVNIQQPNKEMLIQGLIYKKLTKADDVIFVLIRNNGMKHFLSKFKFRLNLIKSEIEYAVKGIIEGRFDEEHTENCEYCPLITACKVLKNDISIVKLLED